MRTGGEALLQQRAAFDWRARGGTSFAPNETTRAAEVSKLTLIGLRPGEGLQSGSGE